MLTPKEIKFLNLIYLKLKSKHMETFELWKLLQEFFRLKDDLAFELAYLYDNNFKEAKGDFTNVKNVKRLSYENYQKSLIPEIVAVMEITKDNNINNYEISDEGIRKVVIYSEDGLYNKEYIVFGGKDRLNEYLSPHLEEFIEDDPFSYVDYVLDHTHITRSKRHDIAIDETAKYVNKELSTTEGIVKNGGIEEEYNDLEDTKNKLNDLLGQLINTEQLMDDYLKLHRLGKEEEDQDEYIKLVSQINKYKEYINAIRDKVIGGSVIKDDMTIEEITNEVDEILYEIDYQIEDLIENTKNQVRENIFEKINNKLRDNPFDYFYDKFNMGADEFLNLDFVEIDYEESAREYIRNHNPIDLYKVLFNVAHNNTILVKGKKYILFW